MSPVTEGVASDAPAWRSDGFTQPLLARYQPAIDVEIAVRHAARGEARLEDVPDPRAIEFVQPPRRCRRLYLVIDDEAGDAVIDDFRHGAATKGDDRCPAGHCLDHREAERLAPCDREDETGGIAEEGTLLRVADLAEILDVGPLEQWLHVRLEVCPVGRVDLGGGLQFHAGHRCEPDRSSGRLPRAGPAD